MTEKLFKMGISRTKKTGIILERELSTDEVFNELVYCVNKNKHLKNENEELKSENQKLNEFRATTYSLINDYLIDAKRGLKQPYKEVLTEIKEILLEDVDKKGDAE